jgi:hemerythrin-like domain-containing protein
MDWTHIKEGIMKPTEDLMTEHRGIERMLATMTKAAARLKAGEDVPPQIFLDTVDFLRNFADKCHHGKEETELFPAMERAGIPRQGGPIGVMLTEHEQGRAFIRAMSDAANRYGNDDQAATRPLVDAIDGYVGLLRAHIYKEDNVLFPMGEAVLPAAEKARLSQAFDHIEETVMGPGAHEHYHAMLDDMEAMSAAW